MANSVRINFIKRGAILAVFALAAVVVIRGTVTMGSKYFQSKKVQSVYAQELEGLDEQKNYLDSELDALVSEDGADYFARDYYLVAKPHERVIIIVDDYE